MTDQHTAAADRSAAQAGERPSTDYAWPVDPSGPLDHALDDPAYAELTAQPVPYSLTEAGAAVADAERPGDTQAWAGHRAPLTYRAWLTESQRSAAKTQAVIDGINDGSIDPAFIKDVSFWTAKAAPEAHRRRQCSPATRLRDTDVNDVIEREAGD